MDEEDRKTLWCGNLSNKITEEILFELFLQAGPIERVSIPKDKDGKPRTFGFINFKHESSVLYAIRVMDGCSLFGRTLHMKQRRTNDQPPQAQQQQLQYLQQQQIQYQMFQQGQAGRQPLQQQQQPYFRAHQQNAQAWANKNPVVAQMLQQQMLMNNMGMLQAMPMGMNSGLMNNIGQPGMMSNGGGGGGQPMMANGGQGLMDMSQHQQMNSLLSLQGMWNGQGQHIAGQGYQQPQHMMPQERGSSYQQGQNNYRSSRDQSGRDQSHRRRHHRN